MHAERPSSFSESPRASLVVKPSLKQAGLCASPSLPAQPARPLAPLPTQRRTTAAMAAFAGRYGRLPPGVQNKLFSLFDSGMVSDSARGIMFGIIR